MSKGKIIGVIVICFIILSITMNGNKNDGDVTVNNTNEAISTATTETINDTQDSRSQNDSDTSQEQSDIQDTISEDQNEEQIDKNSNESIEYDGKSYKIIEVDGGDLSGERQPNTAVDVGFGDRVYWGLTNDYGQLIHVIADEVILQDDKNEPVNSDGRYYDDEAKVPGTEQDDLDEGHVIADALGGVSNAYNITPQDSTLNRHGNQAYMEKVIRDAGGCENFVATITYPGEETQIPSHYHFEYVLNGEKTVDDFDNVNPDEVNATLTSEPEEPEANDSVNEEDELANVDTNGNGKVTIAEAKAAGYSMPINSDNWLYKYMDDRDGDGMVGE